MEEIQIDDRITLNSHGFISGDEVVYQIGAGTTAIDGLTADGIYYVHVIDANTIQLASTREDALAGTNLVNITVTAEHLGGTHQLNARYQSVEVIKIDDRITLNSHGFSSGDEVVYQIGADTTAIDGLTANSIYYVHVIDANTIQLASARKDALAGTNLVNITVTAEHLGGIHQLNAGYQADAFDPGTYAFTYSDEQRAQLLANGKTDSEIATYESTQTQQIKALHSEFGSPDSYDPNYRYQVSKTEEDDLEKTLEKTRTTLNKLKGLGNTQAFEYFFGLLSDVGLTAEEANAIGHDITLITNRGDVGEQVSNVLRVDRNQLLNLLTRDRRQALENAETQGIVQRQGDIVAIAPKEDFDVKATGVVNVSTQNTTAASNVYLGSTGAVAIGQVTAGGEVQIRSSGEVTDGNEAVNNVTYGSSLLILPKDSQDNLQAQQVAWVAPDIS